MNRLHEAIRKLPPGIEFLVVITWAFGVVIIDSILSLGVEHRATRFDDRAIIDVLVHEVLQFAFLFWFLRVRGWSVEKLGLQATWRATAGGVALAAGLYLMFAGLHALVKALAPDFMTVALGHYPKVSPKLSMDLVYTVSVFNGFYEEIFVTGYVVTALRQTRGVWVAVNASVVIRLLYHLYQGPLGIINVVPLGLCLAYLYARFGRLWPVVLAHILIDIVGLVAGGAGS